MPEILLRNMPYLLGGLLTTLGMAVAVACLGTVLAIPLAIVRWRRVPFLNPICAGFIGLVRGMPVLIVLLIAAFAAPALFDTRVPPVLASIVGFTVFLATYCAEDMRAGLLAVPFPVQEAGAALGLTRWQAVRLLVLPLALRIAAPALLGQYVRMVKYTSVASVLGVAELTGRGLLVNARVLAPGVILIFLASCYLVVCLSISSVGRWLERRAGLATRVQ